MLLGPATELKIPNGRLQMFNILNDATAPMAHALRHSIGSAAEDVRLAFAKLWRLIMQLPNTTRRQALFGTATVAAAAIVSAPKLAAAATPIDRGIPELAPQWKKLDLAEILSRPAAFMSVSQNKSLYEDWGAQAAEKQWERGTLEATVAVAKAAREAKNFVSFSWIGYEVFREKYPQSDFDRVQYETWTEGLKFTDAMKAKDNELAEPLKALVQPGDNEFNELALQTAFTGTHLPLELSRKKVQTIILTGIHLDWCIEGNARAARDHGYLPIVIGDACSCQKPEQDADAMRRINAFFAPVISSQTFIELLKQKA
jgi:nicotinamidase-related amidase